MMERNGWSGEGGVRAVGFSVVFDTGSVVVVGVFARGRRDRRGNG
jgi:hypothetical protein